jgi:hypothetical protein
MDKTVQEGDLIVNARVAAGAGSEYDVGTILTRTDRGVLVIAWDSGYRTFIQEKQFARLPNAEVLQNGPARKSS